MSLAGQGRFRRASAKVGQWNVFFQWSDNR